MKVALKLLVVAVCGFGLVAPTAAAQPRPNILWISCEDTSPWLGFCGERYATTPNLDKLARQSVYYNNAFATAPVCAPSRFAIITGLYATGMGTQRLRSMFPLSDSIHGFPAALRQAGYYCTNNVKTDYNTREADRIIKESWDESSNKAHWRNRKPGQPFFAVFNLTETHQSRAFGSGPLPNLDPSLRHDPAKAPLPPYYPDTPLARQTIARVHDCITLMDVHVGQILAELEKDGLKDDTLIFFWPDHGQGIPRGKRTLWDTGLKIPLLVYTPEKFRGLVSAGTPGEVCDRLVSLMDFGPTLLSILDLPIPAQVQGRPFLGKSAAAPRQYVYGARDRVDEVLELARSVRDARYLYIRNYMPHLSWNQPEWFSDQLDLRQEITRLAKEGKLNADQLTYAGPTKPAEALYDTQSDPWQVRNLADDPASGPVMERMRKALRDWQTEIRDVGMIHEWQAWQMCAGDRPLSAAGQSEENFPLQRVLDTADCVGRPQRAGELAARLSDPDPTVRYWAVVGLRAAGGSAPGAQKALKKALTDTAMPVRIEAAGALAEHWSDRAALDLLAEISRGDDKHAAQHAARTLQLLGEKARPVLPALQQAMEKQRDYTRWSLETIVKQLSGESGPAAPPRTRRAGRKAK